MLLVLGVAAAYIVAARLGLALGFVTQKVTLVFPPTAVALAALLLFGYRALPGLVLGAFLANLSTGSPLLFCAATAVGNPLEALVGFWVLRRVPGFDPALSRVRDVVALVVVGTLLSPPFSATLGVIGLCASSPVPWSSFGHTWVGWCLGDGMGVLLFAPALLPWKSSETGRQVRERWGEFLGLLTLLAGAGALVFFSSLATAANYLPLPYLLLPLLLWMTMRFGTLGAGVAVAYTSAIAVASIGTGTGPFAQASMQANIAALLAFMCMIAIVCLILGAMLAEREKSERMLQVAHERVNALNADLEQRVSQRTAELTVSEERFRRSFEDAPIGLALVSLEGRWLRVNSALCNMLGYGEKELLATDFQTLTHPDDLRADLTQVEQLLSGRIQDYNMEKRYFHQNGRVVNALLSVSLVRTAEGKPLYFVAQIQDITGRKKNEAELAAQTEALKRSNQELEQFAYVASHDLQEPLRAISGFSHILKQQCQGKLAPDAERSLNQIMDGARRMAKLIDDLLTVSRVDSQGRPFVPAELEKSLEQAEKNLMVTIQERGAIIRHGPLPTLPVDASQLALLFQNLIGNAIKFCRDRTPEIRVEAARDGNHTWQISVRDNGIGIEPKYFDRIFGIFQRLHTRDEYPGTGIGLAICKKIVERHGGAIWLESEPGAGTTFHFTLPEKRLELNERQPSN